MWSTICTIVLFCLAAAQAAEFMGAGITHVSSTGAASVAALDVAAPALTGFFSSFSAQPSKLTLGWTAVTDPAGVTAGPFLKLTRSAETEGLFDVLAPAVTIKFNDTSVTGYTVTATLDDEALVVSLAIADGATPFPATGGSLTAIVPTRQMACGREADYTIAGVSVTTDQTNPKMRLMSPACPEFVGVATTYAVETSTLKVAWTSLKSQATIRGHVFTFNKAAASPVIVDLVKAATVATTAIGYTASIMASGAGGDFIVLIHAAEGTDYEFPSTANSLSIVLPFLEVSCEQPADYTVAAGGAVLPAGIPAVTVTAPLCPPVTFNGFAANFTRDTLALSWASVASVANIRAGKTFVLTRKVGDFDLFDVVEPAASFTFPDGVTAEGYSLSATLDDVALIITLAIDAEAAEFPTTAGGVTVTLVSRQIACDKHALYTAAGARNIVLAGDDLTVDMAAPKCPRFIDVTAAYAADKSQFTISWKGLEAAAVVNGHIFTLKPSAGEAVVIDSAVAVTAAISVAGWTATGTHLPDDSGAIAVELEKSSAEGDFPATAGFVTLTVAYHANMCGRTAHFIVTAQGSKFGDVTVDAATPECPPLELSGYTAEYDGTQLTLAWTAATGADNVLSGDFIVLTRSAGGSDLFDTTVAPPAKFIFPHDVSDDGYDLVAKLTNAALTITLIKSAGAGPFPTKGASLILQVPSRQMACGLDAAYTSAGATNVELTGETLSVTLTAPACPRFQGVSTFYDTANAQFTVSWTGLESPAMVRGHVFTFAKSTGSPILFDSVTVTGTITTAGYTASAMASPSAAGDFVVMVRAQAGTPGLFPASAGSLTVGLVVPEDKCTLSANYTLSPVGSVFTPAAVTMSTPLCPKFSGFSLSYDGVTSALEVTWDAIEGAAQLRSGPMLTLSVVGKGTFFDSAATTADFLFPGGATAPRHTLTAAISGTQLTFTLAVAEGAEEFPATSGKITLTAASAQTACGAGLTIQARGQSLVTLSGSLQTTLAGPVCPRFSEVELAYNQDDGEFVIEWESLPDSALIRGHVFTLVRAADSPLMFDADDVSASTDVGGYAATAVMDTATGDIDIGLRLTTSLSVAFVAGNATLNSISPRDFPRGQGSITVKVAVPEANCAQRAEFTLQPAGAAIVGSSETHASARGPCYVEPSNSGLSENDKIVLGVCIGVGVPVLFGLIFLALYKTESCCFAPRSASFGTTELASKASV